jgi:uncharacterized membrane protein
MLRLENLKETKMRKLGIVLVIALGVLAALWLGGAGILGYSGFGMDSGIISGIGATIAPVYLALIIGAGAVLVLLLMVRSPRHAAVVASSSALEISRARYAKGEITKEQFEKIKHDLRA